MQRKVRLLGIGVVAVLVLSAATAVSAQAKAKLVLLMHGAPAPVGEEVFNRITASPCYQESRAEVATNELAKDTVAVGQVISAGCSERVSFTGQVKSVQITTTGQAVIKFSPKLAVNSKYWPGEDCTWVASKFTGTVALGAVFEIEVEGEGTMTATKASAAKGCPATRGAGFADGVLAWYPNGNLLTAEILG
jgi:hypothetical protein